MKKITTVFLILSLFAEIFVLSSCNRHQTSETDPPLSPTESKASVVSFIPPKNSPTPSLSSSAVSLSPSEISPAVSSTPAASSVSSSPTPSFGAPEIQLSGIFKSDTGTGLNLAIEWSVETVSEGNYRVSATVFLESYSLICSSRTNCNSITIGEEDFVYSTDALQYDDGTGRHRTKFASAEMFYTAETLPKQLNISATWLFRGVYSKVEIHTLTASGVVDTGI